MGCDIHTYVEVKKDGVWTSYEFVDGFLDCRSYGLFGFLADVRNYSFVPTIKPPTHKWPDDIGDEAKKDKEIWDCDAHSFTWFTARELLYYDYSKEFEDRRCMRQTASGVWNGASDAGVGNGIKTTLREFLGEWYFNEIDKLAHLPYSPDDVRVLIFFDN